MKTLALPSFLVVLLLVTIFYAAANDEVTNQKSLWDLIVKMEQIVLIVEYNGRRLNVWREEVHGYSRFFVTPLCVLDSSSIKCTPDKYSDNKRYAFSFYVNLWDSQAADVVQLALKQKGIEAKASDIIPLPMQMVKLSINRDDITPMIKIDNIWKTYQGQPNRILFELGVQNEEFCKEMVSDAKTDPETFLASTKLHFKFTMFAGEQASRDLNITGKTLMKSDFFAELENDFSDKKTGEVYLQSNDVNKLARDIYRSVSVLSVETMGYIQSEEENQIINELLNEIKGQQVHSNDLTKDEWNSVFWDDIFARPDIQTEYFNETLKFDSDKNHFIYNKATDEQFRGRIEDRFNEENIKIRKGGGGFSFFNIGANLNVDIHDENRRGTENINDTATRDTRIISRDELQEFIEFNKANVKWTGTKFEQKGLNLQRINTKSLQSMGEIFYKRVIITKLAITQELQIQAEPEYTTDYNNTVSPIYYEAVQDRIDNITETFKANIAQIKNELRDHNLFMDNNTNDLISRNSEGIVELKNMLDKIKEDISKNANDRKDLRNLLVQANEHITNNEKTLGKVTTLVGCNPANIPRYTSKPEIDKMVSRVGGGVKKPFEKNYLRFVHAMSAHATVIVNCRPAEGEYQQVTLSAGQEMAWEFTDCMWGETFFDCSITANKNCQWRITSNDKANNFFLREDGIFMGQYDGNGLHKLCPW